MAGSKWQSEETAEVNGVTAGQVWSLLADFCNFQECFPSITNCVKVEGEEGKPDLVRRNTAVDDEQNVKWSNDKLVMINQDQRCLVYEILENSVGVKSHVATFKVVEMDGGDGVGCRLHWSFVGDPKAGITLEENSVKRSFVLQLMVQKIQAYFSVSD